MTLSGEFPHPINDEIQALRQFEPSLYQKSNNSLCELTPNLIIDALVLKSMGMPQHQKLVNNRHLFFGQGWECTTPLPISRLNPNCAQSILLKSIGISAGVVLGDPYQGLIVSTPLEPEMDDYGVFANRVWNDYGMKKHIKVNAMNREVDTPNLTAAQREAYQKQIAFLTKNFTWASQAFLYLAETQLNIYINEADFAVTRRSSH
jgi:hypothetical protein